MELSIETPTTPSYYTSGKTDLYALFIEHFGLSEWQQHAEMEAIQYLWRCRSKGNYIEDIRKAKVILDRILTEHANTTNKES